MGQYSSSNRKLKSRIQILQTGRQTLLFILTQHNLPTSREVKGGIHYSWPSRPISAPLYPTLKFSFFFLMLTVKKYHYNCRWDSVIFNVHILDFNKTTYFHRDNILQSSPQHTANSEHVWLNILLGTVVQQSMPRVCCVHNCQIITCGSSVNLFI